MMSHRYVQGDLWTWSLLDVVHCYMSAISCAKQEEQSDRGSLVLVQQHQKRRGDFTPTINNSYETCIVSLTHVARQYFQR